MESIVTPLVHLVAQDATPTPTLDSAGDRLAGLAGQAAGGLAGFLVAAALAVMYWKLLVACWKAPTANKVLGAALVPLVAVFFAGAAPDLLDLSYELGQSFLSGAP
jgi:hypothetical protein